MTTLTPKWALASALALRHAAGAGACRPRPPRDPAAPITRSAFIAAVALVVLPGAACAQAPASNHAAHPPAAASAAAEATPAAPMAEGEVRKVDKAQGKLTIRHGPIANLDMPGMTMVFKVADPRWLDRLKAGDKVSFQAEKLKGSIVVTVIELAK